MDMRIVDYESISAAGVNIVALREAIQHQVSGLRLNYLSGPLLSTWIGKGPKLMIFN